MARLVKKCVIMRLCFCHAGGTQRSKGRALLCPGVAIAHTGVYVLRHHIWFKLQQNWAIRHLKAVALTFTSTSSMSCCEI